MWGIVTTHYQILKQFAEDTPGLINGSMLYDRHLMQPMFKLSIGNPGSSFAVEIARKIGLPVRNHFCRGRYSRERICEPRQLSS